MARARRQGALAGNNLAHFAPQRLLVQKKCRVAKERDSAKRDAFRQQVAALDPGDLVFLDESGFSLALSVLYGWGRKGEPLIEAVPARRGKNLSVLGAFDIEGMVATTSKQGAMTRADFELFLHTDLLPRLLPGSVLVLDNASIHKGGQIECLVKQAGCHVLYLPPYSPDLNPIELAWSFVKSQVRKRGPREDAPRQQAVEAALAVIPQTLAPACFRHCKYLQLN